METPQVVLGLVDRFECNRDAYCSNQYNETQARHEFIDPFFMALGWDVNNEKGYAEAYKEVIHEDAIKVGGATKAPDYCFRIGGVRKFFVEAKRPGVNIKDDENAAYQLRRYAWSAKLPLSILTDFEEFAVYDSRIKPAKTDKASAGRVLYLTVDQYDERWDEIEAIFSQEAIWKGSFDKYIESTKRKKGTAEVDTAFLKEIENWRDVLARNIALRNTTLSTRELNFGVQRTIDRLIFLRICEDRGIEDYGQLMALQSGTRTYQRLCQIFRRADERYNSGLFHFRKEKDRPEPPDDLTLGLAIDDKVLKEILKDLYYPDSPYEFSVLPADILGHIYEQFLGKVIRLTPGHRAVVEDKPEVKKAGGVYYTPTYIVDYIVEHTVGKLLEGKTPNQVAKLCVLDPACGSGSFLLGAYQKLLHWHQEWYAKHDPEKHARGRNPKIFRGPGGDWRLTTAERKRILLNNIYGVDIDTQAVEVTKLSLLLKVLEGENAETLGKSLRLFHARALPDLGENIKCGNSLIGPDFYEGKQLDLLDEEERYRINAFDWDAEFPEIMQAGGFDTVIGNPPYGKVSGRTEPNRFLYFKRNFECAGFKTELYTLFAEQSLRLLSPEGIHSFIVPNSFLAGVYMKPFRILLAEHNTLLELVLLKDIPVFQDAKLDSVVYVVRKCQPSLRNEFVLRIADNRLTSKSEQIQVLKFSEWVTTKGREFRIIQGVLPPEVFRRLRRANTKLGDLASIHLGLVLKSNSLLRNAVSKDSPDPIILGRDISRYQDVVSRKWFCFAGDPIVGGTKNPVVYATGPRIVLQAIRNLKLARRLICTVAPAGMFAMGTVHNVIVQKNSVAVLYLLGILNSNLMNEFYTAHFPEHRIKGAYLEELPIPAINFSDPSDKARHDQMVKQVEAMLKLHKQLAAIKTSHEKSLIQRQIDATDKRIDQLVYELYALTDEEIRIVEEATK